MTVSTQLGTRGWKVFVPAAYSHGDILFDTKVFVAHLPAFTGFFNNDGIQRVTMRTIVDQVPDEAITLCGGDFHQFFEFVDYHYKIVELNIYAISTIPASLLLVACIR
jgi:hypothetical protein